jgi:hypothetical protein
MYKFLRIESDPTMWVLRDPVDVAQLTAPDQPLAVQVAHPLPGTMLRSCGVAAGVALYGPQPVGWRPTDAVAPEPVLYLPAPAGPTDADPGYALAAGADLARVQAEIAAAMSAGTVVTVAIAGGGELVLNGATLPFAVLCPASAVGGGVT